ncbi:cytochrome P450 [Archangium gephyra]|uniref:Cytochrome P450 n=1 Tax=Archangium gephyra TaxID=48 RepID=A0AAC8TAE7_9BACT|nr:cytochrome P450 [Archangium gephyra]AKI98844.1 cytochrome P450 [Archangium gephyra]REG30761.1 cytochrome P450 [Archangium gephyra]
MPEARTLGEAPGPRGHWFWGNIQERRHDPLQLFLRAHQEYGEFVRLRMGPTISLISVTSPELIKHVLVDHADRYGKPSSLVRDAWPVLGNGLFTSSGDFWKRQRRLMQPSFHKERLATLAGSMVDATRQMLARWRARPSPSEPLDVAAEMMHLTLGIVGRALFSTDVSGNASRVGQALTVALAETNRRILSLGLYAPDFLPTARNRAFRQALGTLDSVIFDIIARRRAGETQGDDLLATLMAAQDADTGERMTDAQLRDEATTLFLAGHETTANALAWLWHLLAQNPEVETRARAEVQRVLGGRTPTAQDIPQLRYLTQVFEEAMRLYPPAWIMARQPVKEDVLAGVQIPASPRVIVVTPPYAIHRNPRLWPEPERFDPERFSPEQTAQRPRMAYLPFGGGQRLCIGNNFALMEATLIIAEVLQHFRLRAVPGHTVEPEPLVTLRPKGGLPMFVEPLHASA